MDATSTQLQEANQHPVCRAFNQAHKYMLLVHSRDLRVAGGAPRE
jgi:hypothetical protein